MTALRAKPAPVPIPTRSRCLKTRREAEPKSRGPINPAKKDRVVGPSCLAIGPKVGSKSEAGKASPMVRQAMKRRRSGRRRAPAKVDRRIKRGTASRKVQTDQARNLAMATSPLASKRNPRILRPPAVAITNPTPRAIRAGDRSGGGKRGPGQKSQQAGQGEPGSQSEADEGGDTAADPGGQETSDGPGGDRKSDKTDRPKRKITGQGLDYELRSFGKAIQIVGSGQRR